jgi:hypothetical protein
MPSSARWLVLLTGLLVLGVGSAHAQMCGTRSVAKTGNEMGGANNCLTTPCLTIQHAVDEVAAGPCPGDMVNVDMGTYAEQVTIGISLTLTGAGAGHTKIQAPATLPPLGDVVQIKGSGVSVEMSALTVAGPGPSASGQGSINDGIHVMNGAQGILHDLAVVDIRDNPLTGPRTAAPSAWATRTHRTPRPPSFTTARS